MVQEKIPVIGKIKEEIAFDFLVFSIQNPGIFEKKLRFSDYEEYLEDLEEYKRAVRAAWKPNTKRTEILLDNQRVRHNKSRGNKKG